jgi:very-short-patch-repair endonuclease
MDEQTSQTSTTPTHQGLRRIASSAAADQDGVLTRTALADLRVTRQATGREIRADRQAALVVCMAAQQRLPAGPRLLDQLGRRHGRTRRAFVAQLLRDVADGAQALGELDFAVLCRRRRLPRPTRQVVRTTARGRIYLDVAWEDHGVVVEVDGAQHRQGLAVTADNLRRNELALGEEIVITIDLVGLRLQTRAFLDQVATALEVGASRRAA